MRYVKLLLLLLVYNSVNAQLVWETKQDIPGAATGRWGAYCFSINDKIYIAGGYTGGGPSFNKPDVPGGTSRTGAVAFAIGGKGYVGLGSFDVFTHPSKTDLWEYDPDANIWTQKAFLPDTGRKDAACFVINNKAYVVGGSINYTGYNSAHVWEYDPASNQWTAKKDYPTGIEEAQAFSVNNTGFVTGGYNNNQRFNSTYQYDAAANDWTKKADQCGAGRQGGVAFVIGSDAYVGLGTYHADPSATEVYSSDLCKYDMASNTWIPAGNLPAAGRANAIACVANGKAYVGAGFFYDGVQNYLKDWHAFGFPTAIDQVNPKSEIVFYPNPANNYLQVSKDVMDSAFCVYDITGRVLLSGKTSINNTIDVSNLTEGLYLIEITTGDEVYKKLLTIRR